MENLINIIQTCKKKFYIIAAILILIIIFLIMNSVNNKKTKKEISNKDYVFTQIENKENQKLPYINIKGEKFDKINDDLYEKFYYVSRNNKNSFNYKYYLDDKILYVFIEILEYNDNGIPNPKYISYYIDIDKKKLYSLEEILNKHNLNIDNLTTIIDKQLNASYEKETELGYVEKGFCDFSCYKDIHDINPINKRVALSFDGKNLKAYLNYNVETIYYVDTNPIEFPHIFDL